MLYSKHLQTVQYQERRRCRRLPLDTRTSRLEATSYAALFHIKCGLPDTMIFDESTFTLPSSHNDPLEAVSRSGEEALTVYGHLASLSSLW